jgi:hypothetical protein
MANFKVLGKAGKFQVYMSVKTGRVQMNDGNESVTLGLNDSKAFMSRFQDFLYTHNNVSMDTFFAGMWIDFKDGLD